MLLQITPTCYDLYLAKDTHTRGHRQWFYFMVTNAQANVEYTFNILNLEKPASLYNNGMQPVLYSEERACKEKVGWYRGGYNICYVKGASSRPARLAAV